MEGLLGTGAGPPVPPAQWLQSGPPFPESGGSYAAAQDWRIPGGGGIMSLQGVSDEGIESTGIDPSVGRLAMVPTRDNCHLTVVLHGLRSRSVFRRA